LSWKNVEIEKFEGDFLEPKDYENGEHAWYVCPHCKTQWTEGSRWEAISAGRWLPKDCIIDKDGVIVGEIPETKKRSYRITALMLNPNFMTISQLASEWVEANIAKKKGDIGPLQNYINSRLAEAWKESEKVTSDKRLKVHIGNYPSRIIPEGVQLLTCGVDIQKDHAWITVEGWGYLSEVWTIYEGRLEMGDTSNINNYDVLRQFLHTPWQLGWDPKRVAYITKTAIDSGYNTDVVYEFCRMCREIDAVPIMGADYVTAMYRPAKIMGGKRIRYDLNVNLLKDRLYRLLFDSPVPGTCFWHLPKDTPEDFLEQLTSEEKQLPDRKNKKARWVLKSGAKANHLWDVKVYSLFAAELIGALSLPSLEQIAAYQAKKAKSKSTNSKNKSSFLSDMPSL